MSKNVVVIGGGHGQSVVLKGIKNCDINLTAIVTVADDGGSTGRLIKEFHIPAMGDIRGVMIALASEETLLTELMNYRFDEGESFKGHSLGNIVLTALTEQTGSFTEAISKISKVLNVKGNIIPSATEVLSLYAKMADGTIVKGESNIPKMKNKITKVYYDHPVKATNQAIEAIKEADYIVYGIGSLYTSILPNLIIEDIKEAIKKSKAKNIYFSNCMSQPGETDGYTLEDHVKAIEEVVEKPIDVVYFANDEIPNEVLERYKQEDAYPTRIMEKEHHYKIVESSLLEFTNKQVRHDPKKIEALFNKELEL